MLMGSPVSPVLAQYVMDDLLADCVDTCNFQIPFIKKYVDDVVFSIPQTSMKRLLQVFNNHLL